jgi:hypothetical protein
MAIADEFRDALRDRLRKAELAGEPHIDVNAGELHQEVQKISPTLTPSMPICCSVMRQERRPDDTVVSITKSDGVSLTVRYHLPR